MPSGTGKTDFSQKWEISIRDADHRPPTNTKMVAITKRKISRRRQLTK
jgi:hypothetical protein